MINPKKQTPVQTYWLENYPKAESLGELIDNARRVVGMKHCYQWKDKDDFVFSFTIFAPNKRDQLEWWLHKHSEVMNQTKMLWYYKTDDYAVIYTQLLEGVGAPDPRKAKELTEKEVREQYVDPEKEKSGHPSSLSESFRRPDKIADESDTTGDDSKLQVATPKSSAQVLLRGNLENKPIANLLRIIQREEYTGHLNIEGNWGWTTIQFGLGAPLHAVSEASIGAEAILEVFLQVEGEISFEEDLQPDSATVQDSVEQLITWGLQYADANQFLRSHRIDESSILQRAPGRLSSDDVEKSLLQGAKLGIEIQKEVYSNIYGTLSLLEVAQKLEMRSSKLLAIVTNLLRLNLLVSPEGKRIGAESNLGFSGGINPIKGQDWDPLKGDPTSTEPSNPGASTQPASGRFQSGTFAMPQSSGESSGTEGGWKSGGNAAGQAKQPLIPPSFLFGGSPPAAQAPPQNQMQEFMQNPEEDQNETIPPGSMSAQSGTPMMDFQNQPEQSFTEDTSGEFAASASPLNLDFSRQETPLQSAPRPFENSLSAPQAISPSNPSNFSLTSKPAEITTRSFDPSAASRVKSKLVDPQTGLFSFEALCFFLEREFERAKRLSTVFTLMTFCIKRTDGEEPLTEVEMTGALKQIESIIRSLDVLGHFGDHSFAIILPNVISAQSISLAERISELLQERMPELDFEKTNIHCGLADSPYTATEPGQLIEMSGAAMRRAIEKNSIAEVASALDS